jgi:hypothetical protein
MAYMEACSTCFGIKGVRDEALSNAIIKGREKALAEQRSIAVVEEGSEFNLYDAFYAYQNGMGNNVKTVVSYLG